MVRSGGDSTVPGTVLAGRADHFDLREELLKSIHHQGEVDVNRHLDLNRLAFENVLNAHVG